MSSPDEFLLLVSFGFVIFLYFLFLFCVFRPYVSIIPCVTKIQQCEKQTGMAAIVLVMQENCFKLLQNEKSLKQKVRLFISA